MTVWSDSRSSAAPCRCALFVGRVALRDGVLLRWRDRRLDRLLYARRVAVWQPKEDGLRYHLVLVRLRAVPSEPLQRPQDLLQDTSLQRVEGGRAAARRNHRRTIHVVRWRRSRYLQLQHSDAPLSRHGEGGDTHVRSADGFQQVCARMCAGCSI